LPSRGVGGDAALCLRDRYIAIWTGAKAMKRVEIRVHDEAGEVVSEQELALDIGSGCFDEIEQAIERMRHQALKKIEGDLLEREQAQFIEVTQKGGSTA
jgi:23S rRNA maturation-related 3'-5' exoribonuclease YhaM